ncbi:Queuosine 5'-phosphate N-glycosylase/hydrolase [Cladobotryum mycophilum]|uniref:Queuosine 5'-phosphate N-glycosylase/hydrolase n=1 Tax=Cladobotryum mycophilum TaxID=491253 RepID=A0ABR0SYL2_9HYPO
MSDDEVDPELLELLRQHLQGRPVVEGEPETGVLADAEYVYNQGIDVAIDMMRTKQAAETIYAQMQAKSYSTATWSEHMLHPKLKDETTVAFIFIMDLLNFSFWSELSDEERFAVEYKGKRWTGYWSLVASLQRALKEGIPITDPHFWQDEEECNLDTMRHIFRSCTDEEMPLLKERLDCLREAGRVLYERYDCSFLNVISTAEKSAARLVNILARDFGCFRDEHRFEGRNKPIRILKRAQILVADLWACFEGKSYGEFHDIDKITIFADYRVPQILASLGALYVGPSISAAIRDRKMIDSGSHWEIQLRACSIWCVELIKREILREHPDTHVNAVLIDFFLYDTMKEMEAEGKEPIPHHRTRSIWY